MLADRRLLRVSTISYVVVDGELYKSRVTEPWLRCITFEKGVELLNEIHNLYMSVVHT
jgi:hypothetical protein